MSALHVSSIHRVLDEKKRIITSWDFKGTFGHLSMTVVGKGWCMECSTYLSTVKKLQDEVDRAAAAAAPATGACSCGGSTPEILAARQALDQAKINRLDFLMHVDVVPDGTRAKLDERLEALSLDICLLRNKQLHAAVEAAVEAAAETAVGAAVESAVASAVEAAVEAAAEA